MGAVGAVDDMINRFVSLTTRRVCRGDPPTCLHARFLERTKSAEELSSRQEVCRFLQSGGYSWHSDMHAVGLIRCLIGPLLSARFYGSAQSKY